MSLAATRLSLRHRCTILRQPAGGTDSWGQPASGDWEPHLTDVPCRAWTNAGREPVTDTETLVVEDRRVSVPLGTDVTEADRVGDVTSRGSVVFAGPMNVQAVLAYSSHLELVVEAIR